ncbi:alpha/beta fold hydrolase [Singulisphaera sp. PoT]|uniref:alpha/beta fold hydrolase n=1 Tax=Singulisphaera sp. PoT TaxID=3411797 RepID=UPI003BF49BBD
MPFSILGIWFRGLVAIAIIAGGITLLKYWYDDSHVVVAERVPARVETPPLDAGAPRREVVVAVPASRVFRFRPGINRETGYLAGGVGLLLWASLGAIIRRAVSTMLGGSKPVQPGAADEPRAERTGEVHWINRPDGSQLRVECYGPADAPPVVMTHGWGCNSTEWFYPKKDLAGQFRLILWDEPGLGLSSKPDNNDYRLENLAEDLKAVLDFAGARPAVLVGHSIGGMITLTLCKTSPELLRSRIAGLVLAHTTYKNPVRTTKMAGFYTAIEKPVIIPMLYVTIALWPLVWAMNWLNYLNGSAHRSTHKDSFAGTETRGQLDFFARFVPHGRPDVLARGMLGMIGYDATQALPGISVPTLVVVGDKDTTTLSEAGHYIRDKVPGARLVTLSPGKHLGLIEHHGRFDAAVAEFAGSCQVSGATF